MHISSVFRRLNIEVGIKWFKERRQELFNKTFNFFIINLIHNDEHEN